MGDHRGCYPARANGVGGCGEFSDPCSDGLVTDPKDIFIPLLLLLLLLLLLM